MSQKFRSLNDARAGSREIRICVHGINPSAANRRKFPPAQLRFQMRNLFERFLKIEPARRENQDFRRPFQNVRPLDTDGIRSLARQLVNAAGELNHFRHPMSGAINWISPFHAEHAGTMGNVFGLLGDGFQSFAAFGDECFGCL